MKSMLTIEAKSKGRADIDTSRDISLRHEYLVERSFAGLRKASFAALGCTFERCDLSGMRPRHMSFAVGAELTRYVDCKFDKGRFDKVVVGQVRFERCSFLDIEMRGFFGHAAEFVDCRFSGVLRGSAFFGRIPAHSVNEGKRNDFRGNDFSAMTFIDVDFRGGIDLSSQKLPRGPEYLWLKDARDKLAAVRRTYIGRPASEERREIFEVLSLFERSVADGQTDLFLQKEPPLASKVIWNLIWEDLRRL